MDVKKNPSPFLRWGDTYAFAVDIPAGATAPIIATGPQLIEARVAVPCPWVLSGWAVYVGGAHAGDIIVPGLQATVGLGSSVVQPWFYDAGTWIPIPPTPEQIIPSSYITNGAIFAAQSILAQPVLRIVPVALADPRTIRFAITVAVAPWRSEVSDV